LSHTTIFLPMQMIYELKDIDAVVQQVWQACKHKKVWLFDANMGSGKTTFINALCKYLQVKEVSSSPTFSIINEYKSEVIGTIYHLDLYRLKDAEDAVNAGVEDVLYNNNYCFVEWPEKALEIMPDDVCHITINLIDTDKREIIID